MLEAAERTRKYWIADLTAGTASVARMMPTASVMVSSIREKPARRFARLQLAVRRVEFECVVGICTFSYLPESHRATSQEEYALQPASGKYRSEAFSDN